MSFPSRLVLALLLLTRTLPVSGPFAELSVDASSRSLLALAIEQIYSFQPAAAETTLATLTLTTRLLIYSGP